MESLPSKNPDKGKKPSEDAIGREEEIVLFIGNLRLREDSISLDKTPSDSQANNVSISRSNSYQVPKTQSLEESWSDSNEVSKIENPKESSSDSSGVPQILNRGKSVVYDDLSGDTAESPHRNSSSEYNMWSHDLRPIIENFIAGSFSRHSRTNSFHGHPSYGCSSHHTVTSYNHKRPDNIPNPSYGCSSRHTVTNYNHKRPDNIPNYRNTGFNLSDRCNTMPTYEPKRQNELLLEGSLRAHSKIYPDTVKEVMNLFREADYNQRERLISFIRGSISWIMANEQLHSLFLKVVDLCDEDQLSRIVEGISSQEDSFIKAAFCTRGSSFIVELIRKLKRTDHAYAITSILASRLYELTTHHTARNVIKVCLSLLDNGPNKVLYEQAIALFKHLAVTAAGCRSLNDCIDTIVGYQRTRLLLRIAHVSDFLSHDPYGNYVVQHVLELRNENINATIFIRLQGQFVLLAKKQAGSHVVEKCLESCSQGTLYVVQDILHCKGAAILLARDQFGNYVIQTALRMTKMWSFTDLYGSLVNTLERYYEELKCTTGGRQVISLIEDELHYRWKSKFNGKEAN